MVRKRYSLCIEMTKKSKVRIRMKFCPYCGSHDVVSIYDVFEREDAEWANFYASTTTHGSGSVKYCSSCRKYYVVVGFGQERLRRAVEYWKKRDEERS